MKKRAEKDVLGKIDVDENAYYGSFTQRARENFQLSGIKADSEFIKSLAMIKKAAAMANSSLEVLDRNKANAIIKAADEVIANKFSDNFVLDVFQAGAGTPFNMNMNEVIANRATELLGGKKGQYLVHPNNDVNMAQSSNDVIPTAVRLASLFLLKKLMVEIKNSFKSDGYESYLKPSLEINKITSLISELNKKLSKEQKKIFEELKNCSIERVENGGSHRSL